MKCSSNRCIFFFFLKYTKLYKKCSRKRLNVDICKPPLTRRRLIRPNVFFHKSKHLIMRKRSQVSIDMAYSNEIFFSLFKRVQLSESTVVFALFFFFFFLHSNNSSVAHDVFAKLVNFER